MCRDPKGSESFHREVKALRARRDESEGSRQCGYEKECTERREEEKKKEHYWRL